jgi:hypothetical protein
MAQSPLSKECDRVAEHCEISLVVVLHLFYFYMFPVITRSVQVFDVLLASCAQSEQTLALHQKLYTLAIPGLRSPAPNLSASLKYISVNAESKTTDCNPRVTLWQDLDQDIGTWRCFGLINGRLGLYDTQHCANLL